MLLIIEKYNDFGLNFSGRKIFYRNKYIYILISNQNG